ncbi:MAG: outer membrane lipoprotein-sorting protein, partial [Nitrospinota bacterium]
MKTRRVHKVPMVLALALFLFRGPASAKPIPSVEEIVRRSNLAAYYQGKDGRSRVKMTITDRAGRTRRREFTILRRDTEEGGRQKFYVYFHRPSDVRRMVFMVWKNPGREDDRWLYLPALDLVRRIAASDKRSSFVGSHFFYEDVSGRGIEEDRHELVRTEENRFVLKNTPVDPSAVEFAHYLLWIDRKTYLPMKAEYYDKNGKRYRVIESLEVRTIQGHPTVTRARARDLVSGGQ